MKVVKVAKDVHVADRVPAEFNVIMIVCRVPVNAVKSRQNGRRDCCVEKELGCDRLNGATFVESDVVVNVIIATVNRVCHVVGQLDFAL